MDAKLVYSPHVFRNHIDDEPDMLPVIASEGRAFYLVTPSPFASPKDRRYLYALVRKPDASPKIVVTRDRSHAMAWSNLQLAESYAEMLADGENFDNPLHDFWITMEPPTYKAEQTTKKRQFETLSEIH